MAYSQYNAATLPSYTTADYAADLLELCPQMANEDTSPLDPLADPVHREKLEARRQIEAAAGQHLQTLLAPLPTPGTSLHIRMDGTYTGADMVAALVDLMATRPAELHVASLSFNRRTAERLIELLDSHKVSRLVYLSSAMFAGKEKHLVSWFADELQRRGSRLVSARNHCKLILIQSGDQHIVTEGSANLRSCNCYEQWMITDSPSLYDWHRRFIEVQ